MNRDEILPVLRALEEPLGELERASRRGTPGPDRVAQPRARWRRQAEA